MAALKPVMIRVEASSWATIAKLAAKDGVSQSEYVRRLIKRSIAQRAEA